MNETKRPGGKIASRPLHFFWICDVSGSMVGEKIQALNYAIREAVPHMQKAAAENAEAQILVRVIKFSDGASWHVADPVPVEDFRWTDLSAGGVTDMGRAFTLLTEQIRPERMPERGLPPVFVLISDGQPTDDYESGLKALLEQPWGIKAVRVAIAIGEDADQDVLQQFIANPEVKPLSARNPEQLVQHIRWVSTQVVKAASAPPSVPRGQSVSANVILPVPQETDPSVAVDEVW